MRDEGLKTPSAPLGEAGRSGAARHAEASLPDEQAAACEIRSSDVEIDEWREVFDA